MRVAIIRLIVPTALPVAIALFAAGCDKPSPEQLRQRMHLPAPGFQADAAQGRALFAAHCVVCHGAGARGSAQGPPLVDKVYRPGHHADLSFHRAVKDGVKQHHWQFGDMPPMPEVTPEQTAHIVAYLRGLQRAAGIE